MRIAILGCGPTGLLAAHACAEQGRRFDIFSKKRKSELYGSQYLHEWIPGLVDYGEGENVTYVNIGTPEEYRRKTHGKYWDGIVAPEDFETHHMAWNIREAYDRLWRKYSDKIQDYSIPTRGGATGEPNYNIRHPHWQLCRDLNIQSYDLVISTVPRKIWAIKGEEFQYSLGWAMGDAPEKGIFVSHPVGDMTIICDGSPNVMYNRLSRVFGYATCEWPAYDHNVFLGDKITDCANKITKPLKYVPAELDINPVNQSNWLHVGRFGSWQKGVVTTDAYRSVVSRLRQTG